MWRIPCQQLCTARGAKLITHKRDLLFLTGYTPVPRIFIITTTSPTWLMFILHQSKHFSCETFDACLGSQRGHPFLHEGCRNPFFSKPLNLTRHNWSHAFRQVSPIKFYDIDKSAGTEGRTRTYNFRVFWKPRLFGATLTSLSTSV